MGQALSSCTTKKKPPIAEETKYLKKMEKILKKHPSLSDEDWQKIATKYSGKMEKNKSLSA